MVPEDKKVEENELDLFLVYAEKHRGLDLSYYRKNFLLRRLKSRLMATKVEGLGQYLRLIKKYPDEWNNLLNNLSINVSEFFRDPEVFAYFKDKCLPELLEKKIKEGMKIISCWSCGCAYGEEPYSLAIIFKEFLRQRLEKFYIRIWATDVDAEALKIAEKGEYANSLLNKIDKKILGDYFFASSSDTYKVNDEIKRQVIFKKHNLFTDEPLKSMDVVFLRNVRIYFNPEQAEKVLTDIAASLRTGGYLILGKAETMPVDLKKVFTPLSQMNKIFKRV